MSTLNYILKYRDQYGISKNINNGSIDKTREIIAAVPDKDFPGLMSAVMDIKHYVDEATLNSILIKR